jgi:hypothetical protein
MSDISMVDMRGMMAGVVVVVLLLEVVDITETMVEEDGEGMPPTLLVGFSSSSKTCKQQMLTELDSQVSNLINRFGSILWFCFVFL